ncbi:MULTISPECIES: ImmA/IrrE family metallo-endopeptidase [Enterococcus]|uniref:IrrE N-terminal-like domain-containing protein n=1 Tax=Candidatus Enterococcus ferrettii TaxID=2815324 RepID=A0ABV0EUJ1_9ENTE|nr:ImmA/IrrE family metallo-endopeptidase [Enterococcus sp. 665A]MBO1340376.1 ImmA/IrrE family metallo-endopeptidase [Enterococcus sp. 665A]
MSGELEEYVQFSTKINEYLSATMLGLEMNVENYNHEAVWQCIMGESIKIRGFYFEGKARQTLSGMIVKDAHETTITYNKHMNQNRINFTISHELIHYLYHLNRETPYHYDTKQTLNTYDYKSLIEFQANIGAAAILLPDPVFINVLKQGKKPADISKEFGISETALKLRLIQTMQAEFSASYEAASKTSFKILNQFGHTGQTLMKDLGTNLERKIIDTNPFYEALCI